MLPDISPVTINVLADSLFIKKGISVELLRLDKIHPIVSGNKLFKLRYFLEQVLQSGHRKILTFGGAYSNHLVATAYAGKVSGIQTIGIARGERPALLSPTLQECQQYGMQLKFIPREVFSQKDDPAFLQLLQNEFGEFLPVPEGGYHPTGARGAATIMELLTEVNYTHIITALGSATTLAGLILAASPNQKIVGVPVLKGMTDIRERIQYLTGMMAPEQLQILNNYHFGGYAKKTDALIQFMNLCWQQFDITLDYVYTAKMLYAVFDQASQDYFPRGSRIICLHTGGLQGNRSLPVDTLLY